MFNVVFQYLCLSCVLAINFDSLDSLRPEHEVEENVDILKVCEV